MILLPPKRISLVLWSADRMGTSQLNPVGLKVVEVGLQFL